MSLSSFTETAPHETGFAEVYAREILPIYRNSRAEAETLQKRAKKRAKIVAAVGLFITVSLLARPPFGADLPRWVLPLFPAFIFTVLTLIIATSGTGAFSQRLKEQVMPILARFLEIKAYHSTPPNGFVDIAALEEVKIFSAYDRLSIEDGLEGIWRDVPYRVAELNLRKRRSSSEEDRHKYDTVFRGLVMEITSPVALPDTVIMGKFGNILDDLRETFVLPDRYTPVAFEAQDGGEQDGLPFAVYSVNPNAARAQFGPVFLEKLQAIAQDHAGKDLRLAAAFGGTTFRLTLHRRAAFLEINALSDTEEAFAESCRTALADMARPARIIDLLIGET